MDWKIFLVTFGSIFLAELADKTQLVGITISAKSGRPLTVWAASALRASAAPFVCLLACNFTLKNFHLR